MELGIRHFIVEDGRAIRVSQKKRQGFYLRRMNTLPEYAGKIIDVTDVMVELRNRKPIRIIRIDCMRHKVNIEGGPDSEYESEHGQYIASKLDGQPLTREGGVIDTSAVFDEKRLERKFSWKLSDKLVVEVQT